MQEYVFCGAQLQQVCYGARVVENDDAVLFLGEKRFLEDRLRKFVANLQPGDLFDPGQRLSVDAQFIKCYCGLSLLSRGSTADASIGSSRCLPSRYFPKRSSLRARKKKRMGVPGKENSSRI